MDGREALEQGISYPWEVSECFGVPEEMVCFQVPLSI